MRMVSSGDSIPHDESLSHLMQAVLAVGTAISGARAWSATQQAVAPVLVFDQPGRGDRAARQAMQAALVDKTEIWIWPSAEGTGWLARQSATLKSSYRLLPRGLDLSVILQQVSATFTVDADEGWLALLAGCPLHVYGRAHYAGWGLTQDYAGAAKLATASLSLPQLFEIVYQRLACYRHPSGSGTGSLELLLESLALQQQVRRRFADMDQPAVLRFQLWKRRFAAAYLGAGLGRLRWVKQGSELRARDQAIVWGGKPAEDVPAENPVYRIEDGFFHSCGLGSDMVAPRSQVIDRQRLYFDARGPSDLSDILNHHVFTPELLLRAARLREQVCKAGVTKYNLGRRRPVWRAPAGARVVLVPGQVADDASIRFGTGRFASAEDLLLEVRRRRPEAFIVYKPHPDVLSGNRKGLIEAAQLADIVDSKSDVLSLIEAADEVHTLSSLAGFDALLRGREVVTYGKPFYAGWGLTEDVLAPLPWRERELTLDALVAGALILYPVYWDWQMQLFCTPESVVEDLQEDAARPLRPVQKDRLRFPRKMLRWLENAVWYARHGR